MQSLPLFEIYFLRFEIFLPRFEIPEVAPICNSSCPHLWSIKSVPIYNPLIVPFCNPDDIFPLFRFSHFGTRIWTWLTFDFVIRTWIETSLLWYLKTTLVLINLTLVTEDIMTWYCFSIEIQTWITLDSVIQFWWNFVSKTFGMSTRKWLY